MKYTHSSKQTTAMFKAFSQIVCRIKTYICDRCGEKPRNFSRETVKKLNGKGLNPLTFIPFKVSRPVFLFTSNRRCYRSSLQFHFDFKINPKLSTECHDISIVNWCFAKWFLLHKERRHTGAVNWVGSRFSLERSLHRLIKSYKIDSQFVQLHLCLFI